MAPSPSQGIMSATVRRPLPGQHRPAGGDHYQPEELRRLDLRNAVSGVEVTPRDERLLDWLGGWDQDTTGALADLIVRARNATQGPPMTPVVEGGCATQSTTAVTPSWRALTAAAFNHDDDTWRLGEGGELLLDVLIELMHPPAGEHAVTDNQLAAALDRALRQTS